MISDSDTLFILKVFAIAHPSVESIVYDTDRDSYIISIKQSADAEVVSSPQHIEFWLTDEDTTEEIKAVAEQAIANYWERKNKQSGLL